MHIKNAIIETLNTSINILNNFDVFSLCSDVGFPAPTIMPIADKIQTEISGNIDHTAISLGVIYE